MLFRQNLRRSHEGSLPAGLHRQQHRCQRHQRFSGSDIALKQAIHPLGRCEVTTNFADDLRLRTRQGKRELL